MASLQRVDELLQRHYEETSASLVDTPPSQLRRGEGTEKQFFIMKVDLVGSTRLLWGRRPTTYLRLAHTFLSTVHLITREFGADDEQVEYAGDSVLAYFPDTADAAARVLTAAYYARASVVRMERLDGAVGALKPQCRIVLHYAPLTVARIGPRSVSTLSAIGMPIHTVAKLEDQIASGVGRATPEFRNQVPLNLRKYLSAVVVERQVPVPPVPTLSPFLPGFMGGLGINPPPNAPTFGATRLRDFQNSIVPTAAPAPAFRTERTTVGYNVIWPLLARELP